MRPEKPALRLLWITAVLALATCDLLGAQNLQVSVSAPKEVAPGSTVTVTVDLANVANLGALLFDVTYDGASLSLEGVDAAGLLAEQGLFASNPETFPSTSGKLTFGFLHAAGLSSDGTLVKLAFKVATAPLSPATLDLGNATAVNVNLGDETVSASGDNLTVLLSVVNLEAGLRMFTVPVQLTNGDPAAVFNAPAAQLKVAAWDPTANNGAGGYVIYDGGNVTFEAGKGYWVKLDAATQLKLTTGRGIPADQSFAAPVSKGWTLLGNPRNEPLTWSLTNLTVQQNGADAGTLEQARSAGLLDDYAWVYDGQQYVLVYDSTVVPGARGSIAAGEAFWVHGAADNVSLVIPPVTRGSLPPASSPRARSAAADNWDLRLTVSCGDAIDTYNFLGVRPGSRAAGAADGSAATSGAAASTGVRLASPPPLTSFVDLSFVNSRAPGQRLAVDFRPPLNGRAVWNAVVETDVPDEDVVLAWSDLTHVPNAYRLTLIDKETGKRLYMRTTTHYRFHSGPGGVTRQFAVEVDPSPGAALLLTGLHVTPGRDGSAAITFTSSQPATVTAQLRSSGGRRVEVVSEGFTAAAGMNTLHWSGRTRAGSRLPRGIYLLQLIARTDEGQTSRAATPFVVR